MEEWRRVPGFPNYEVNENGDVRNSNTLKYLKMKNDRGYKRVTLYKDGVRNIKQTHRLVAELFIENPECKAEVNHIDGNKHNNNVNNLEWCSRSENMSHAFSYGLKRASGGVTPKRVRVIETDTIYDSLHECARAINGDYRPISDCLKGKIKSYKKLHFEEVL